MTTGDQGKDDRNAGDDYGAAKLADAAVRQALVEARHNFMTFLLHRLGNRDAAEEVLQRFALAPSNARRNCETSVPCEAGLAASWRQQSSITSGK